MEVVHADLGIVVIAAIAVRVDGGNGTAGGIVSRCTYAPGIVVISGDRCTAGVGNADDIALQVLLEVERLLIIDNAANGLLGIVQGNQNIFAPGFLQDLATIQCVLVLHATYSFTGSDAVGIIGVCVFAEGLQLPALFPNQGVSQIFGGVALGVVGDGLAIVTGQQVGPCGVVVAILLTVLGEDITVVIVGHGVDNHSPFCIFSILSFLPNVNKLHQPQKRPFVRTTASVGLLSVNLGIRYQDTEPFPILQR